MQPTETGGCVGFVGLLRRRPWPPAQFFVACLFGALLSAWMMRREHPRETPSDSPSLALHGRVVNLLCAHLAARLAVDDDMDARDHDGIPSCALHHPTCLCGWRLSVPSSPPAPRSMPGRPPLRPSPQMSERLRSRMSPYYVQYR